MATRIKQPTLIEAAGSKPKQKFDEYTVVLSGTLRVECENETLDVGPGQSFIAHRGDWVRYSTPLEGGAEYLAVCLPAFSPSTVHRDEP
jgi:mannose-6-phosphate isomerase-like protein (cupin superfamily)